MIDEQSSYEDTIATLSLSVETLQCQAREHLQTIDKYKEDSFQE